MSKADFEAGVAAGIALISKLGGSGTSTPSEGTNADIVVSKKMLMMTDTRNCVPTYTNGKLTRFEEKDDTTVIKTTDFSYNADGTIATIIEVAGEKTSTITITYAAGVATSITKEVV